MSPGSVPVFPLADADLCVKCGLCLPHCPTYVETGHEGDSPRGRIALMQGLATQLVPQTRILEAHLDGCLVCRRCEFVCPAKVPYGELIDAGRAQLASRRPQRTWTTRLLGWLLVPRLARASLRLLIEIYRRSGAQTAVRRFRLLGSGRLARFESLLPESSVIALPPIASTPAAPEPRLAVFRGCVTDLIERPVLEAAERLLSAAGYELVPVPKQTCCGALHQHGGLGDKARALARSNIAAFAKLDGVAATASGCAATLKDYPRLAGGEGRALADKTRDVHSWLRERADRLHFRPLPLRAALHRPCTLSNVLRADDDMHALLQRIPQLQLFEMEPAYGCCGAAGSYFLTEPQMADRLLQHKLDAIQSVQPDLVLSGNIGCTMHLSGGLVRRGHLSGGLTRQGRPAPPVRHPLEVLAAQLAPPPRS